MGVGDRPLKSLLPRIGAKLESSLMGGISAAKSALPPAKSAAMDSESTRLMQINSQIALANKDPKFRALVVEGDSARDRRDWSHAEYCYWRALQLYPLHPGYRIQYAHMLKERADYVGAELNYRSALASGAAWDEIEQHVEFVSLRNGGGIASGRSMDLNVLPLDAPPTLHDLECFEYLVFHRNHLGPPERLQYLRICEDNRNLIISLLEIDEAIVANRKFSALMKVC